jgi:hypothetical protein
MKIFPPLVTYAAGMFEPQAEPLMRCLLLSGDKTNTANGKYNAGTAAERLYGAQV